MKKIILGLILLGVLLISGCIQVEENTSSESTQQTQDVGTITKVSEDKEIRGRKVVELTGTNPVLYKDRIVYLDRYGEINIYDISNKKNTIITDAGFGYGHLFLNDTDVCWVEKRWGTGCTGEECKIYYMCFSDKLYESFSPCLNVKEIGGGWGYISQTNINKLNRTCEFGKEHPEYIRDDAPYDGVDVKGSCEAYEKVKECKPDDIPQEEFLSATHGIYTLVKKCNKPEVVGGWLTRDCQTILLKNGDAGMQYGRLVITGEQKVLSEVDGGGHYKLNDKYAVWSEGTCKISCEGAYKIIIYQLPQ
ncbi:MAG: hypothetical protein KKD75_02170 [Nanoarchaeota archaeon]|nr:hypothetical protein [Nanoarchaeota archaeon]MBU1876437.1 hypothetical protein [Nanoarchaeota archaeon]